MSSSDSEPPLLSHPADTREFFLPGNGVSALLVHGLTGTPYEMRFLGERLAAAGARVFSVRLAGHCGSAEELGSTNHNHWYESVVDGCERLRAYGDPIVVVGQSAGAVLSARLAVDQRDAVSGVVMLAPAFFLPFWQRTLLRALRSLGPLAGKIYLRGSGADLHDAAARQIHPGTRLMSLGVALSLAELQSLIRPKLGRLNQPTLVIHSRQDHTCPFERNVEFLASHIGGKIRLVVLEDSYHVISVDSEKQRVADEVVNFVRDFAVRHQVDVRAMGGFG